VLAKSAGMTMPGEPQEAEQAVVVATGLGSAMQKLVDWLRMMCSSSWPHLQNAASWLQQAAANLGLTAHRSSCQVSSASKDDVVEMKWEVRQQPTPQKWLHHFGRPAGCQVFKTLLDKPEVMPEYQSKEESPLPAVMLEAAVTAASSSQETKSADELEEAPRDECCRGNDSEVQEMQQSQKNNVAQADEAVEAPSTQDLESASLPEREDARPGLVENDKTWPSALAMLYFDECESTASQVSTGSAPARPSRPSFAEMLRIQASGSACPTDSKGKVEEVTRPPAQGFCWPPSAVQPKQRRPQRLEPSAANGQDRPSPLENWETEEAASHGWSKQHKASRNTKLQRKVVEQSDRRAEQSRASRGLID